MTLGAAPRNSTLGLTAPENAYALIDVMVSGRTIFCATAAPLNASAATEVTAKPLIFAGAVAMAPAPVYPTIATSPSAVCAYFQSPAVSDSTTLKGTFNVPW